MNIAQRILHHYNSNDFKGMYYDCILEDSHYCIGRIKEVFAGYEFEQKYGLKIHLTTAQATEVFDHIKYNVEEFTEGFRNYWVGHTSIDSVSFGEQEQQLSGVYNHRTKKDYTLPYMRKVFDQEGFSVNGDLAYMDMSSEGLHVDLLAGDLTKFIEKFKSNQH